jgi:hypothetical protein
MYATRLFKGVIPPGDARFIQKYGLRPDRRIVRDVHCGRHSGLPDCCILFFITCYRSVRTDEEMGISSEYHKLLESMGADRLGYVPCPACLAAQRFVRMRPCNRGDRSRGLEELCQPCRPGCQKSEHDHSPPDPSGDGK